MNVWEYGRKRLVNIAASPAASFEAMSEVNGE
jgi:hypothetical protein